MTPSPTAPETFTPQTAAMLQTSALRLADVALRYAEASSKAGAAVDLDYLAP